MTPEQATAVYDILVRHAGARGDGRDEFVHHLTHGCTEFRFMGSLGFGGKLYVEPGRWRVDCYPEDSTAAREAAIRVANAALNRLHDQLVKL
ncbi:hypothetical protein Drose_05725 [Dactylosporangium roseum]|uniref:Uncharacterized protein n=1 Tax=Dactylosporangium roseum TaxID=47989 RepID=A0ABY5ZBR0_9ACTN|nr:hypothetical protein [Dactylosporangium roseum]UWZ37769.1 hypothetical protein Drose_05725 [Dactylosporangium roseum]